MESPLENEGRHPLLHQMGKQVDGLLQMFEGLPNDHQMEGLDLLQNIVNKVVDRITQGRVCSVRFVPVESEEPPTAASAPSGVSPVTIPKLEIKNEPQDDIEWEQSRENGFVSNHMVNGQLEQCNMESDADSNPQVLSSQEQPNSKSNPPKRKNIGKGPNKKTPKIVKTKAKGKQAKTSAQVPKKSSQGKGKKKQINKQSLPLNDGDDQKQNNEVQDDPKEPVVNTDGSVKSDDLDKVDDGNESDSGLESPKKNWKASPWAKAHRGRRIVDEEEENDQARTTILNLLPLEMRAKEPSHRKITKKVGKYKCEHCEYSTHKPNMLRSHMTLHTGHSKFSCTICNRNFTANSSLKRHMMVHEGQKPYSCPICGRSFVDMASLRTHSVVHTGERHFKCDQCPKIYTNSANLSRHKRIHTGAMPYGCKICDTHFRDMSSLKLHTLRHTGEKPYTCNICDKPFRTSSEFRRHERTHTGERKYKCKECGKLFLQSYHLKQHTQMHADLKPWECPLCNKKFRTKSSLQHHERSHAGVKNYECAICKKRFTTKKYLQCHQVVHTQEKPFRCESCGQHFNQLSNLKRHERMHSTATRYKCKFCGKAFKYINSLQYHEGIHTGDKYTCEKCGMSYRSKAGIKKHVCDPTTLVDRENKVPDEEVEQESDDPDASFKDIDIKEEVEGFIDGEEVEIDDDDSDPGPHGEVDSDSHSLDEQNSQNWPLAAGTTDKVTQPKTGNNGNNDNCSLLDKIVIKQEHIDTPNLMRFNGATDIDTEESGSADPPSPTNITAERGDEFSDKHAMMEAYKSVVGASACQSTVTSNIVSGNGISIIKSNSVMQQVTS